MPAKLESAQQTLRRAARRRGFRLRKAKRRRDSYGEYATGGWSVFDKDGGLLLADATMAAVETLLKGNER